MEKIASFTVDHTRLLPGVYVSRKDMFENRIITTFDLRMKRPNKEPVMDGIAMHTIEHLGATFLRNDKYWGDKVVYFGGMLCYTGFYLVVYGDYNSEDVLPLLRYVFKCISEYEGEIPGATEKECGNYLFHNLPMAKYYAREYLDVLNREDVNTVYPE